MKVILSEPTKDQVETRYQNFLSKSKFRLYQGLAGVGLIIIVLIIFLVFVPVIQNYEEELFEELNQEILTPLESTPELEPKPVCSAGTVLKNGVCVVEEKLKLPLEHRPYSILIGTTLLGMGIGGFFLLGRGIEENFNAQQKIFFEFYHTYIILQKFVDLKSNNERKKASKRIRALAYYIEQWVGDRPPNFVSDLPNSIKKNLNEKLLPLINHKRFDEVSKINQYFQKFAYLVYDDSPNENELLNLNGKLSSIPPIPEVKPPKIIKRVEHENAKAIVVSSIISITLGFILAFSELGWGAIVLGSAGIGVVSFLGIRKKKQFLE